MLKKYIMIVLTAVCFLGLSGCAGQEKTDEDIGEMIGGKTYVYEKEGFGGEFTIELHNDGTFSYYEGALCSYYGIGKWRVDGDIVRLSDDAEAGFPRINYFKSDGNDLIFLSEDSSGFSSVEVSEGDRFFIKVDEK